MSEYKITFTWDNESAMWIATSDDVLGLVLEHGSFDALLERVRVAVPELLELDGVGNSDVFLNFAAARQERLIYNG